MAKGDKAKLGLSIDGKAVVSGLQDLSKRFDRFEKSTKKSARRASSHFNAVGRAISGVKSLMLSLGGALTLAALVSLTKRMADVQEAAGLISLRLGIAVKDLTAFQFAAKLGGLNVNTFNMALQRMARRISEAGKGTGEALKAIAELGLDRARLASLPLADQLNVVAQALKGVASQSDRVRLAFKFFDSEGVAMLQLLPMLGDAFTATAARAKAFGAVITEEGVKKATEFKRAMAELGARLGGVFRESFNLAAPWITKWTDKLTDFLGLVQSVIRSGSVLPFTTPAMPGDPFRFAEGRAARPGQNLWNAATIQVRAAQVAVTARTLAGGGGGLRFGEPEGGDFGSSSTKMERLIAEHERRFRGELVPTPGGAISADVQTRNLLQKFLRDFFQKFQDIFSQFQDVLLASGKAGQILGSGLNSKTPQEALVKMATAFIVTSKTFQNFISRLDRLVELLQRVLEPLMPVLNELSVILLGVSRFVVAVIKPLVDLYARYILPQLRAITRVLQGFLGIFGITFAESDFASVLESGSITLALDTSEARQQLEREQARLLGALTETEREVARQRFLSAREALILAEQARQGQLGPLEDNGDFWGFFEEMLRRIFDGIWNALGVIFEGIWNSLRGIFTWAWNSLRTMFSGIWNALWGVISFAWHELKVIFDHYWLWLGRIFDWAFGWLRDIFQWFLDHLKSGGGIFNFAHGTNFTTGGPALLHAGEAVVPARYNPANAAFNPAAFINPFINAMTPALAGAGGGITLVVNETGQLLDVEGPGIDEFARTTVLESLHILRRRGDVKDILTERF